MKIFAIQRDGNILIDPPTSNRNDIVMYERDIKACVQEELNFENHVRKPDKFDDILDFYLQDVNTAQYSRYVNGRYFNFTLNRDTVTFLVSEIKNRIIAHIKEETA